MKRLLREHWEKLGLITDKKALDAFEKIPREYFVLKDYVKVAYEDRALPIIKEQTISQPTTVMIMTQALEVKEGMKILEIGTGSGYQAALLSKLVGKKGKVISTEIIPELAEFAKKNLKRAKVTNVKVLHMDGAEGYKKEAPYDRIIITAATPKIPEQLIGQLKNNGILIAPVGSACSQEMIKIRKLGKKTEQKEMGYFMFVPLTGKHGAR